jgi:hypothetical protein
LSRKLLILVTIVFCLSFSFNNVLRAQEDANKPDTVGVGGTDWFAYPFVFYSPETNWAFGAGGIIYFKLSDQFKSKPSSITASGFYTINEQFDITIIPEIYLKHDQHLLSIKFNYGEIFDYFYGVGSTSPDIPKNQYLQRNFILNVKYQMKAFEKNLKVGPVYEGRVMDVLNTEGNPLLDSNLVRGSTGGTTSGIGFIASYDTRDNIFYPSNAALPKLPPPYNSNHFGVVLYNIIYKLII